MSDFIKKYKTEELIDYLRRQEDLDQISKYSAMREFPGGIKQFNQMFEEIDDGDKALGQCMNKITLRLSNLETMQTNANEATRVTSILNVSLVIVRRLTNE
ncbi:hypothetical protein Glove_54g28 [Diversispora epigaea]|uniref:Uncharacterized protein n=1 Tax=Diversispora epigaea TaxID=1348612 RepID=A0A397JG78_9GLOM|nr:hypothetical protein Glove_54g28 [Diversispora epigaea]